jgi:Xaa-Pro aminopeptidase
MTANYAQRRTRLRAVLREHGLDAMLVTDLVNVRYLTGFTGSNGALLLAADDDPDEPRTVFGTDGRYRSQSAAQVPDLRAEFDRATVGRLAELAPDRWAGGFESHVLTVDQHAALTSRRPEVDWRPLPGAVERLRMVKDDGEAALLRQACGIADTALAQLLQAGKLRPGRTERQVARDLEWLMFEAGADAVAFETIVAAGANSAIPHHRPTSAVLAQGDFVKIDFGAVSDGYHSDMTRTFVLGSAASWQREIYAIVAEAQAAGRAALAPGAAGRDVDAAARSVIEAAGYGEQFVHGLGHGVGLQIHEAPSVAATATGTLPCGAAVTVEPGIYLPGRGGVRIEDTLIVRDGDPDLLTRASKDLIIV